MTFDNFKVRPGYVRDPQVPRVSGSSKAVVSSSSLKLEGSGGVVNKQFGFAAVQGFTDDYFMVQADLDVSPGEGHLWVRCLDVNDGYRIRANLLLEGDIYLDKIVDGKKTQLGRGSFPNLGTGSVKVKVYNDAGSHRFKIWVDGTLKINVTDSTFTWGGVAFGGADGATACGSIPDTVRPPRGTPPHGPGGGRARW